MFSEKIDVFVGFFRFVVLVNVHFLYINLAHVNDNIGRRIFCVVENRISGEND